MAKTTLAYGESGGAYSFPVPLGKLSRPETKAAKRDRPNLVGWEPGQQVSPALRAITSRVHEGQTEVRSRLNKFREELLRKVGAALAEVGPEVEAPGDRPQPTDTNSPYGLQTYVDALRDWQKTRTAYAKFKLKEAAARILESNALVEEQLINRAARNADDKWINFGTNLFALHYKLAFRYHRMPDNLSQATFSPLVGFSNSTLDIRELTPHQVEIERGPNEEDSDEEEDS